jgi:hypothetical protein
MIRYSIQELKTVISQLVDLIDVVLFQRSFIEIAFCYSSEEAQDVNLLVDRKILELSKK